MLGITNGQNGTPREYTSVDRVIVLGFYDGATGGLLQFEENGSEYQFDLDPEYGEPGLTTTGRSFILRPLPANAIQRVITAITPFETPRWPVWFVRWHELSESSRENLSAVIDAIEADAGPAIWQMSTADPWSFSKFAIHPIVEPQTI